MRCFSRCIRAALVAALALLVFGAAPVLANPSDGGPSDTDEDDDDGLDIPKGRVGDPDEIQFPDAQPRAHDEIEFPDAQPRAHDEIVPDKPDLPDPDAP